MTVLIVGKNNCNDNIRVFFAQRGMDAYTISDVSTLRSLKGEVGSFIARTVNDDIEADIALLTEQPYTESVEIAGLSAYSLFNDNNTISAIAAKTAPLAPIVFLLDYTCESPMASTIHALRNAAKLARGKRNVYYLARFIRTAGRKIESLYKDAREAGVTFVKYENLQINADLISEEFTISVSDGKLDTDIKTNALFADSGAEKNTNFANAVKKLNLKLNKHNSLTEGDFFLAPVLTGRRGVYHLTQDIITERIDEALEYIYLLVKNGIWEAPSLGTALIDGKKCVLCYNCYRACSHAALEPDPKVSQMQCLTEACEGCGVCAGICPANAISLDKDSQSKNIGSGAKTALIFSCENSAAASVDESILKTFDNYIHVDTFTVPCGGFIDMERLTRGLNTYDKILTVTCPDDACRHFDGNKRACAQVKRLQNMLETAGIPPERVSFAQISPAMQMIIQEEISNFLDCSNTAVV
ncbi:MAG: hydrogenase iron-sulfur subunit [Oscillospiraceae bacterium]|jgi:coenzyme F420-reducing hydrogenase delta subunit/Pyruvate/2-oxoacid:ferredoxin oxidoreductase delta subunit|nr:hydrogenase iron-sulfur subunit [Oscillospiraceae bacterium]